MKALYFSEFGDPSVLRYGDVPDPVRGEGEALVRTVAVGLNFADVYRRRGNYHLEGEPPYLLGYEGAGVVEEADAEGRFPEGTRVAFADVPFANGALVAAPAERLVELPGDISFETAAAVLLQGLTAQYLTRDSYPVREGDTVLVHAAAGGVGQLLSGIARLLGGRAYGFTSTEEKAERAREAGAEEVALYAEGWPAAVRSWAGGGVDVAYDSVGSTLAGSFEATRIGGTVVFYGMAGGDPEPVDPRMLMDTSKTLVGGDLWNVLVNAMERRRRSAELFEWLRSGRLRLQPPRTFPLSEGASAHRLLESRRSTGKILLLPGG